MELALHDPEMVFGQDSPKTERDAMSPILPTLLQSIEHRLKRKPLRLTINLEISCLSVQGIQAIRQVLQYGLTKFAEIQPNSKSERKKKKPSAGKKEKDNGQALQKKQVNFDLPNGNHVDIRLYLETSPTYVLTAQSKEKGKALEAINLIYREIRKKATESGVSVRLLHHARMQIA